MTFDEWYAKNSGHAGGYDSAKRVWEAAQWEIVQSSNVGGGQDAEDAARYRWLKANHLQTGEDSWIRTGDDLEEAIDAGRRGDSGR